TLGGAAQRSRNQRQNLCTTESRETRRKKINGVLADRWFIALSSGADCRYFGLASPAERGGHLRLCGENVISSPASKILPYFARRCLERQPHRLTRHVGRESFAEPHSDRPGLSVTDLPAVEIHHRSQPRGRACHKHFPVIAG